MLFPLQSLDNFTMLLYLILKGTKVNKTLEDEG